MRPIAKGLNQLDSFGVRVEIIQIMKAQGNASQSWRLNENVGRAI